MGNGDRGSLRAVFCSDRRRLRRRARRPRQRPLRARFGFMSRGAAQVQAVATMEDDRFVLRGELSDDVGAPVAKQEITLDATSANGGRAALPPPVPCAPGGRSTVKITGDREYGVETDEHGAFCLRGSALPTGTSLHVRFAGSPLYEKSEATVSLDPQAAPQARAVVRFESPLEAIDLDREIGARDRVAADRSRRIRPASRRFDRQARRPPAGARRRTRHVDRRGDHRRGGRARFEIKTEKLPPPGEGELRLRFDGTPTLAKGSASQTIVRRAEVKLAVTHVPETNDPEEGVPIDVDVSSSRGAVTSGLIEALQEGDSVGAGIGRRRTRSGDRCVHAQAIGDRAAHAPLRRRRALVEGRIGDPRRGTRRRPRRLAHGRRRGRGDRHRGVDRRRLEARSKIRRAPR